MSNRMRTVWAEGKTAFGAWISSREPLMAEAAAAAGYDYVCLDMQHGLMSFDHVTHMLAIMSRMDTTSIVRVPWNEPGIIGRVLDAGAEGVIIPMVNSPAEALSAVNSCFYGPKGSRSMGPTGLSARTPGGSYFSGANADVICIPMIETKTAVEQLDEILSVPGIDAVYVGPADLSITYGLPPATDQSNAEWRAALARIVERSGAYGVVPGVHADPNLAAARVASGFKMITMGFDVSTAIAAMRNDISQMRTQHP